MVPETSSPNIPYKTKEASAKHNRTTSPGRRRTTTYSTDAITRREASLVSEAFLCPSQTCFACLLACLLSKGFRTWLLCQSWRWSEGGGRGGGLGMTREACNGCKTRRERRRRRRRRRGFLRKTTKECRKPPQKKPQTKLFSSSFFPR